MYKTLISVILWPVWYLFFIPSLIFIFLIIIFIPRKFLFIFIRPLCWIYCFLGGQWLRRENSPPSKNNQPYIFMFNHASMFDQFMIGAYILIILQQLTVEIFRYPIWGYIIKKYGVIPIVRQKIKKAIGSLNIAQDALKNGTSFLISPEGTRTTTGQLGPFKKGPFHLAKNTGATIVPIGLIGGFKAKKKEDWRLNPGILTTRFGIPITQQEYVHLDVIQLRALVRERIQNLIEK